MKMAQVEGGRRIAYWEHGDGEPVVQVHGVGTGHKNFSLLTPHLATKFRVIDVDLPGYGASDQADHARTVYDFADDVAAFVRAIGLEKAHVHGSSMGGRIVLALASRHPHVIDRLVASLAFGRPDTAALRMRESWRQAATYGGLQALVDLTCLQGFSRAFWDRSDAERIIDVFVDAAGMTNVETFIADVNSTTKAVDLEPDVIAITAPTLLLAAEEDIMNPLRMAPSGLGIEDLARLIPNARVRVLPGGHFVMFEHPEKVAEAITEFLSS
jgi:pimeloyl-ACP methyl ester carboxylesterase